MNCGICKKRGAIIGKNDKKDYCGICAREYRGYDLGKLVDQCFWCDVWLLKINWKNHYNKEHKIKNNIVNL